MSENKNTRRQFLFKSLVAGAGVVAGTGIVSAVSKGVAQNAGDDEEMVNVLTTDGKLIQVPKSQLRKHDKIFMDPKESREGIPDRKFVMVIDLGRCKNARKCVEQCQKGHHLPHDQEYMKIYLMQESTETAPYWMPKPCFHCDKPQCVSVCPVGATFKRTDGIVLVDNERCIGCKFCMTGCPYSARIFAWKHIPEYELDIPYSPETGVPGREGTVSKCDFCPDLLRIGKLPYCASGCPMGAIYFGDLNEDIVTNGSETVRFSNLMRDRSGYRHLDSLGTEPNVYYLPPYNRQFPVERGWPDLTPEQKARYENTPYSETLKRMENEQ